MASAALPAIAPALPKAVPLADGSWYLDTTAALQFSFRQTKEIVAANVMNTVWGSSGN